MLLRIGALLLCLLPTGSRAQLGHHYLHHKNAPRKDEDKCEIEIFTRGSCLVNNALVKPKVILSFEHKNGNQQRQTWTGNVTTNRKGARIWKHLDTFADPPPLSLLDVHIEKWQQASSDLNLRRLVANEFVIRFVNLLHRDYAGKFDPLVIEEMQFVKLKHWGDANIYDLKIYGLKDLKAIDTKLLPDRAGASGDSNWRFTASLSVANLTASFKVDANLNNKIVIKRWALSLLMERAQLQCTLEIDFTAQVLKIDNFQIKSIDNLKLISESLSWPFNEVVSSIVNTEKYYIKNVIELNLVKFVNNNILSKHFDLQSILEKIMRN